ncbi:TPA: hypothetical protein U1V77_001575 [Streptococcus suis]|nr:hypothetical protein [Streptococcus suis]
MIENIKAETSVVSRNTVNINEIEQELKNFKLNQMEVNNDCLVEINYVKTNVSHLSVWIRNVEQKFYRQQTYFKCLIGVVILLTFVVAYLLYLVLVG